MGGYGSGRGSWGSRPVREECLTLDSYRMQTDGVVSTKRRGSWCGSLTWRDPVTQEVTAWLTLNANAEQGWIQLQYKKTTFEGEVKHIDDRIHLETIGTNFGGSRYLFRCPNCSRRYAMLYLPPGGLYFRCRRCYNLIYQSSNDSRRFDGLVRLLAGDTGLSSRQVKRSLKGFS